MLLWHSARVVSQNVYQVFALLLLHSCCGIRNLSSSTLQIYVPLPAFPQFKQLKKIVNQFLKTKNRATLSLAQSHWATVGVLLWLVSVLALTLWINFRHIKSLYCSRPNYGYTTTFRRNYIMTYVMPTPKHTTIININIFIVLTNISRYLLVCSPCYRSQRAILRRFWIRHWAGRRLLFRGCVDASKGGGHAPRWRFLHVNSE